MTSKEVINAMAEFRPSKEHEDTLEKVMKEYFPNIEKELDELIIEAVKKQFRY